MNVFEALRARYPAPAWAFLEEVRNGTGFGRVTRTADALAMSLYPSRGLLLHGFEVKVSRSDWVRELEDPDKAEEIARFCHFWWLVVGDAEIVKDGELPATWGLLAQAGDKLVHKKEPLLNKEALPPTHRFLGAILRKFGATSTDNARVERARAEGHNAGWKAAQDQARTHTADGRAQQSFDDLRARLEAFEKESGIAINQWGSRGNIGAAVRILTHEYSSPVLGIERLARDAAEIARQAQQALAQVKAALPPRAPPESGTG
jgi:hypothetical protein